MLVDDLKKQVAAAVKANDAVVRDVLRLALGELQTAEARKNGSLTEEEAGAIVRKLIKSNEETLALTGDDERAATLKREVAALTALLPAQLSVEQIVSALAGEREAVRAAKNDGQATGIAMKHLKASGAVVNGTDVGAAVRILRST